MSSPLLAEAIAQLRVCGQMPSEPAGGADGALLPSIIHEQSVLISRLLAAQQATACDTQTTRRHLRRVQRRLARLTRALANTEELAAPTADDDVTLTPDETGSAHAGPKGESDATAASAASVCSRCWDAPVESILPQLGDAGEVLTIAEDNVRLLQEMHSLTAILAYFFEQTEQAVEIAADVLQRQDEYETAAAPEEPPRASDMRLSMHAIHELLQDLSVALLSANSQEVDADSVLPIPIQTVISHYMVRPQVQSIMQMNIGNLQANAATEVGQEQDSEDDADAEIGGSPHPPDARQVQLNQLLANAGLRRQPGGDQADSGSGADPYHAQNAAVWAQKEEAYVTQENKLQAMIESLRKSHAAELSALPAKLLAASQPTNSAPPSTAARVPISTPVPVATAAEVATLSLAQLRSQHLKLSQSFADVEARRVATNERCHQLAKEKETLREQQRLSQQEAADERANLLARIDSLESASHSQSEQVSYQQRELEKERERLAMKVVYEKGAQERARKHRLLQLRAAESNGRKIKSQAFLLARQAAASLPPQHNEQTAATGPTPNTANARRTRSRNPSASVVAPIDSIDSTAPSLAGDSLSSHAEATSQLTQQDEFGPSVLMTVEPVSSGVEQPDEEALQAEYEQAEQLYLQQLREDQSRLQSHHFALPQSDHEPLASVVSPKKQLRSPKSRSLGGVASSPTSPSSSPTTALAVLTGASSAALASPMEAPTVPTIAPRASPKPKPWLPKGGASASPAPRPASARRQLPAGSLDSANSGADSLPPDTPPVLSRKTTAATSALTARRHSITSSVGVRSTPGTPTITRLKSVTYSPSLGPTLTADERNATSAYKLTGSAPTQPVNPSFHESQYSMPASYVKAEGSHATSALAHKHQNRYVLVDATKRTHYLHHRSLLPVAVAARSQKLVGMSAASADQAHAAAAPSKLLLSSPLSAYEPGGHGSTSASPAVVAGGARSGHSSLNTETTMLAHAQNFPDPRTRPLVRHNVVLAARQLAANHAERFFVLGGSFGAEGYRDLTPRIDSRWQSQTPTSQQRRAPSHPASAHADSTSAPSHQPGRASDADEFGPSSLSFRDEYASWDAHEQEHHEELLAMQHDQDNNDY